MTTGTERKEQEREIRRQDILNTAARMFAQKDFHSVTVDEIAMEVGLSKGTIYLYFENKENLFYSILMDRTQKLLDLLGTSLEPEISFLEGLKQFIVAYTCYFDEHKAFFKLMHSEKTRTTMDVHYKFHDSSHEILGRFMGIISKLLEKGIRENRLRSVDVNSMSKMLAGMLNGFTFYRVFMENASTAEEDAGVMMDLILNGIKKPIDSHGGYE